MSFLLNLQSKDTDALINFLQWFMKQNDPPLFKAKMYLSQSLSCSLMFKSVNNNQFKKTILMRSIEILAN